MRLRWLFLVLTIGLFSLLFWCGDIVVSRSKIAIREAELSFSVQAWEDTLLHTMTVAQRRELDSLTKGISDSAERYLVFQNFWQGKAGGTAKVIAHYYLGERAWLQNNILDLWKAGRFLVELLDITPQEALKHYFAQVAHKYLARANMLQAAKNNDFQARDSLQIALAVTDLYGSQPMQGVTVLKNYAQQDTALFAVRFLVMAYFKIGKNLDALNLLRQASVKAPSDMILQLRIAEAYERLGQRGEARQVYQKLWQQWHKELPAEIAQVLQNKIRALQG